VGSAEDTVDVWAVRWVEVVAVEDILDDCAAG
jgi:hypothetical protein